MEKISFNKIITTLVFIIFVFSQSTWVLAFKPKTHVWIAQQVLNDVLPDCKVTIKSEDLEEKEYVVAEDICEALKNHQKEYRMGFIGPDTFPDPIVGQMTVHPGNPENSEAWQSDEWLRRLLIESKDNKRMKSFAYGYLGHAASDIFAHTYVNTYAGDIFSLRDCKNNEKLWKCIPGKDGNVEFGNEEKRHFALEAYIAQYTPPITDNDKKVIGTMDQILDVPAKEVADLLILNEDVLTQYKDLSVLPFTAHLVFMADYREKVKTHIKTSHQNFAEKITELKKEKAEEETKTTNKSNEIAQLKSQISDLESRPGSEADKNLRKDLNKTKANLEKAERAQSHHQKQVDELDNDIYILEKNYSKHRSELEEWEQSIYEAIVAYISMSAKIGIELTKDAGTDIETPIKEWGKKYTKYFLPVEYKRIIDWYQRKIENFKSKRVISWLIEKIDIAKKKFDNSIKRTHVILADIFLSESAKELLEHIYFQDKFEAKDLDDFFRKDKSGKNLLEIKNAAARIKKDMFIEGNFFNPDKFTAVYNSIVLSKLTLLAPDQLNKLLRDYDAYSPDIFPESKDFNILIGAVRSIDGNHQWMEYAPPYLRSKGDDGRKDTDRRYGYGYPDGFKLWAELQAREKVFRKIFKEPLEPNIVTP